VLTVASIQGGAAANVVASKVTIRGTVRWLDPALRDRAMQRIEEIAAGIASALRVDYALERGASMPVLRCAEAPQALLAGAATAVGMEVFDPGVAIPASEDFANYAERVPSGFIGIGAGGEGCGAHHAPDFAIDERAIGATAETLARAALARLA
jgi:metal-dependent amidase/aminoacylase/carboxypeptidase family protein